MSTQVPVIIDNGSGSCKVGYAGEDYPVGRVPTLVCYTEDSGGIYIGEEVRNQDFSSCSKQPSNPIERGIIQDWDGMEKLWLHAFKKELKTSPEDHPVLLSDAALNAKRNKERMAEVVFEKLNVPAAFVCNQGVLSLYASGRTTGAILDCGEGVCQVTSVYEGYGVPEGMSRLDIGGDDLTEYLIKAIGQKGHSVKKETVRDAKERLCYVAQDYKKEMDSQSPQKPYLLPDETVINVNVKERISCPEALFQPSILGLELQGVHQQLHDAITNCDVDIRRDLYANIVVCGGSSMFSGFEKRIQNELVEMEPRSRKIDVIAPRERKLSAWIGGSILASLSNFDDFWVPKTEYEEFGPSSIHRKA